MALRHFLVSMFPYAKPSYSTNIDDIKKILYLDRDDGTVYKGTQAQHYNFSKSAPYTSIYDWLANQIWLYLRNLIKLQFLYFQK